MNSKITKRRLALGLSYDWVKLIVIVILISFFWVIAYTVGAPRASVGQQFQLFVYQDFSASTDAETLLKKMKNKGVFSYDILDLSTRTLTSESYDTIMSTVAFASEGDIMVISNFEKDIKENASHFKAFVDNYGSEIFDFESMILGAKNYCLNSNMVYFDSVEGVYKTNDSVIRSYFATRMKKDPRFRKVNSEKYEWGVSQEIQRIKLIWNNANLFEQCLNAHPELGVSYHRFEQSFAKFPDSEENKKYFDNEKEKIWALNLSALTGGETPITDLYSVNILDENGALKGVTSEGIVVCAFSYSYAQPDHAFETIQVLNYFIKTYSNFLDGEFENLID